MATRSRIAILKNDDTVTSVYCHWDGYPSNNGKILLEHYTDEKKIRELLSGGHISILGEKIHPDSPKEHNFDNREENCTLYYHRDRGEDLVIDKYISYIDWNRESQQEEFNYIWKNGEWYFKEYGKKNLVVLKPSHCA